MKKIIPLLFFIVTSSVYAQNSGITYQAVIYNPSTEILPGNNNPNVVLAEKNICLRFSISDANSSIEYQEVQKVKTDEFGMVNLIVGDGDQVSGYAANFDAIIWNSSNKYLKVEIDTSGNCTNFIEISNQKFASVPYAFASKVAETVSGIVPIVNGGTGAATVAGAKTNLGLNNVDNTSDLNKPVSTATQKALDAKENAINKSSNTALGTSDILFPTQNAVKVYVDTQIANTTVPDASVTTKGKIQLAGDLGGTADAPTVPGLVNKENTIAAGTTAQYYRGDKTWQTLDKTVVGLANVENTSDANKPVSTATQAALDLKAPLASPGFTGLPTAPTAVVGTSTTQIATTAFVNAALATAASPDATTTLKGRIQLAGDLAGTADAPTIATNAITTTKIAAGAVTDAKITSVTSSKIIGSIPVTQINGAVSKVNGVLPDGDGSVVIPFGMVRTGTFLARPAVGSTTNGDIYVVSGDSNTNNNGLTYISDGANWNEVTPNQASLDARYLKLGGGTMSGNIVVPTGKFVSIADAPTNPIDAANKAYVDSVVTGGATPNATTTSLGKIQLAGDLEGTADVPLIKNSAVIGKVLTGFTSAAGTVVASDNLLQAIQKVDGNVALKQDNIALGTTSQYYRGDKSWETLDKTAVGLDNVDDTSDADKPVSTATQAALDSKVDKVTGKGLSSEDYTTAEKTKLDGIEAEAEKNVNADWNATTGDALILNKPAIPSIAGLASETFVNNGLALKANLASPIFTGDAKAETATAGDNDTSIATTAFVNTAITNAATQDATTTATGKIQLGGDLAGTGSSAASPVISNNAITTSKLADDAVTNAKIGETIAVENGGTGATSLTGYLKGNGTSAFTSVSTIPVTDVTGAVRSVNGVVPASDGNVAVIIGRVFTGSTVDPDLATSIINASPAKQSSDIYVVASTGNPDNGRTFIYDGTNWLEVATDLSTTDARYVNEDGDIMEGDLTFPTGTKIIIDDAPTASTHAVNKAYVDNLITSSATPDATDLIKGKIKLAGDLGGTADLPTVPDLALKAPLESPSLTGTPLAPTAAAGTNTQQIATTAFVTEATSGMQDAITLTTTGTGAASLVGSTLNIPTPNNGTVTQVSALTIGTSGTDITSTVATSTTTPVITLNVPTASAANRGALSAADWTTFNNKVGGSGTTNFVSKFTGSSSLGDSSIFDDGTHVGIGNASPSRNLDVVNRLSTHKGIIEAEGPVTGSYSRAMTIRMRRGVADTPAAIQSNDVSAFAFAGFDGTAFSTTAAGLAGLARENWTSSNKGMALTLSTTQNATTVLQERMRIDHNGNVGIGITSPTAQFEVATNNGLSTIIRRGGSADLTPANLILQKTMGADANTHGAVTSGNFVGRILFSASNGSSYRTDGTDIVGYAAGVQSTTNNGGGILFRTVPQNSVAQSIERLRIADNGNIGIGTTNPVNKLDVVGGFNLRNTIGNNGSNYGIEFNTNSNSPRIDWVYNGAYTGSFAGDADYFFRLQNSRPGTGGFRFTTVPTGGTAGLERMTILNNGNIGIGTTAPATQLHTTGSVRFAGAGTPGSGKALISDASGNATWQNIPGATSVTTRTTNYTLTSSDNAGFILVNSTGVIDITIPATLPAGFYCQIIQQGTGQVRIVSPGVTMNSALGFFTRAQGSSIGIMMATSTIGFVSGDTGL